MKKESSAMQEAAGLGQRGAPRDDRERFVESCFEVDGEVRRAPGGQVYCRPGEETVYRLTGDVLEFQTRRGLAGTVFGVDADDLVIDEETETLLFQDVSLNIDPSGRDGDLFGEFEELGRPDLRLELVRDREGEIESVEGEIVYPNVVEEGGMV